MDWSGGAFDAAPAAAPSHGAPPPPQPPQNMPDPYAMSVKELKAELANLGVNFADCYEKTELQAKLAQVQEKMRNLLTIDARTTTEASAVVIFMHGLGDTGHGWMGPMHAVSQRMPHVKFILPNAPILQVTLNQGQPMPAWFDIHALTETAPEDAKGIEISEKFIGDIIKDELGKVPAERIVLGGFSQGGAVALNAALRYPKKLAGVFSLSGWAPNRTELLAKVSAANKSLPVLMAHGDADNVVDPKWGKASFDLISGVVGAGKATFKSYPGMAHQSTGQEMNDLSDWLSTIIPA